MDETWLLNELYRVWERCNARFFGAKLKRPVIEFGAPRAPNENAAFYPAPPDGSPRYVIRKSMVTGTHPEMKEGEEHWQGRGRFVADLMLRLMVRQWVQEWPGQTEENYRGYGPLFRDKANEIGRKMRLEPVRTVRDRSRARKNLPVCSGWPHNRRPADYYLGAYEPRTGKKTALEKAEEMLGKLSLSELKELRARLATMIQKAEDRRTKAMAVHAMLVKNRGR